MTKGNKRSKEGARPVHLAWTGGWDSTFRLLQLLLVEKRTVQPHYIVRPEASAGQEIDAMHFIRRKLFERDSSARSLLLPTVLTDVRAIQISSALQSAYDDLKVSKKVNYQYLLLAAYCEQMSIQRLEIGVLDPYGYQISDEQLVRRLALPLFGKNKRELLESARAHGFSDLMGLTVFCRRPVRGTPCGFCGPRHDALSMGLGFRIPMHRRVRAYIQAPFRRWWRVNYSTVNPRFKAAVGRLLKGRY